MYIAIEIDEPFGADDNDLPVEMMQKNFNTSLIQLLHPNAQATPKFEENLSISDVYVMKAQDLDQERRNIGVSKTRKVSALDKLPGRSRQASSEPLWGWSSGSRKISTSSSLDMGEEDVQNYGKATSGFLPDANVRDSDLVRETSALSYSSLSEDEELRQVGALFTRPAAPNVSGPARKMHKPKESNAPPPGDSAPTVVEHGPSMAGESVGRRNLETPLASGHENPFPLEQGGAAIGAWDLQQSNVQLGIPGSPSATPVSPVMACNSASSRWSVHDIEASAPVSGGGPQKSGDAAAGPGYLSAMNTTRY